uniref:FMN hydroxy acid dehydrogenase domain-containing protein n=1 Tax=Ascaris lumbricoides TaxID=6252 RepID=A0A0M3IBS6_ASCLU
MLNHLTTIEEIERAALERLPLDIRQYYAGGSGTESSLRRNKFAFDRLLIRPHVLRDISTIDTSVKIFSKIFDFPIGIAATAFHKLADPLGEIATVKDHDVTKQLLQRIADAGFDAVVLTVDTPVLGRRPADKRNAFNLPAHLSLANINGANAHMKQTEIGESAFGNYVQQLFDDSLTFDDLEWLIRLANINGANAHMKQTEIGESAFGSYVQQLFDDSLTFDDLEWLIRESKLPIIVKGVMRAEDADIAVRCGVKGIIVSNHGGRQLDFTPATVFIDGGVRNGGDIFKAIALGADSVFVGRPILWGLTLAGKDGVRHVLQILRDEFLNIMQLAGCRTIDEIRTCKDIVVHEALYSRI